MGKMYKNFTVHCFQKLFFCIAVYFHQWPEKKVQLGFELMTSWSEIGMLLHDCTTEDGGILSNNLSIHLQESAQIVIAESLSGSVHGAQLISNR